MRRAIKFNVWNIESKRWEEGLTVLVSSDLNSYKPERYIFCEFTGFTGKENKEIFEWDIVTNHPTFLNDKRFNFLVRYHGGGFRIQINGRTPNLTNMRGWSDFYKIGNLFENPDLLNFKVNYEEQIIGKWSTSSKK
jgi:hypothetical protein